MKDGEPIDIGPARVVFDARKVRLSWAQEKHANFVFVQLEDFDVEIVGPSVMVNVEGDELLLWGKDQPLCKHVGMLNVTFPFEKERAS